VGYNVKTNTRPGDVVAAVVGFDVFAGGHRDNRSISFYPAAAGPAGKLRPNQRVLGLPTRLAGCQPAAGYHPAPLADANCIRRRCLLA
jgi:hypothetical protein